MLRLRDTTKCESRFNDELYATFTLEWWVKNYTSNQHACCLLKLLDGVFTFSGNIGVIELRCGGRLPCQIKDSKFTLRGTSLLCRGCIKEVHGRLHKKHPLQWDCTQINAMRCKIRSIAYQDTWVNEKPNGYYWRKKYRSRSQAFNIDSKFIKNYTEPNGKW